MSTEEERLDILIRAKTDQYLGELGKAERATRGFTDGAEGRLKRLASNGFKAAAVAAGALSVAVVGIGVSAVKTAAKYEQALTNALSVTGLVGEEMEVAREQADKLAKQLGRDTAFSAQEAANAMYDLASKGYEVSTWAEALPGILSLASATQADLAATTELVTSTINQFNLAQSESTRVADVYAKAISASAATQDKLALSMRYVGPVASALGWQLEDTVAVLGRLYDAGFQGEQAGTAMRQSLLSIQNPAGDAAAVMDRFGISAEQLSEEKMPGLIKRLADGEATAGDVAKMFGTEAAPAILGLIKAADDPKKSISGLTKSLDEAGGTAERIAKQQLDTASGQLKLLKSSIEGVSLAIGKTFLPALKDLAAGAIGPLNDVSTAWEKITGGELWKGADTGAKVKISFEFAEDLASKAAEAIGDWLVEVDWSIVGEAIAEATIKAVAGMAPLLIKVAPQMAWELATGVVTGTSEAGASLGKSAVVKQFAYQIRELAEKEGISLGEAYGRALNDGMRSVLWGGFVAKPSKEVQLPIKNILGLDISKEELEQAVEDGFIPAAEATDLIAEQVEKFHDNLKNQIEKTSSGAKVDLGSLLSVSGSGIRDIEDTFAAYADGVEKATAAQITATDSIADLEPYIKTLTGLYEGMVSPVDAWTSAVETSAKAAGAAVSEYDASKTSLREYLAEVDKQLTNWTNMASNLESLATQFGPEFGADVIMKAAELGPDFVAALVGADEETVRTALGQLDTAMGQTQDALAQIVEEASRPAGESGGATGAESWSDGWYAYLDRHALELDKYGNVSMSGGGASAGRSWRSGFLSALSNIDTLIEEKLYMKNRASAAGESAAGSAEGGGAGAALGSATGNALVGYAKRFLGVPYKWGGSSPSGFDCSGLMQYVHRQFGISIPRVSRNQYKFGRKVSSPLPGDMVFFGSPIHHVGMYAGGGKMVEAPYTGARVRVSNAFRRDYAGAATYLYDKGGLLPEGMTTILNASGAPEIILPGDWIERLTAQITVLVDAIRDQVNADKEIAKGTKGAAANELILELFGNRSSLAGSYVSREAARLAMQQATGADIATQTATLTRQIEFIDKAITEAQIQLDVAKSRGMDQEEINRLAEALFDLQGEAADARDELEALARVPLEQAAARWNTAIGQTQMLMDLLANSSSAYGLQTGLFPELMGQLGGGYQTALDLMNASTNPADIMGYADQALTGLSSMFAAEKAQLDRALDATLASIDGSQDDYERAWQARSDALDEELDRERELLNEQYNTQRDALRKQLENLQKAQRDELNALNKFYEDKLRLLDDREREITRADEKRSRQKSIASKEARLRELLGQEGKTYADVAEIERLKSEIQEGRDELARAEAAWEREDQRLALQREREQAIERLELQHELQTTALQDQIEADEKRLEAQHKAAQERLDARRDELQREREMQLEHFATLRRQAEAAHQAEVDAAVEKYRALMQEVIDQQNALLGEQTDYYNAGYALGKSFADGVLASLPLIEAAGLAAAEALSNYLELHSPADMGPLASLDTWFEKFLPTLLTPFNPPAAVRPVMDTAVPTTKIVHEHRIMFDGDATGLDVHELAREVGQIIGHDVEVRRYGY